MDRFRDPGARIDFQLLGPLTVMVGDRPVPLGGIRARAVLALLLIARGRAVPEGEFVDALWGDDPPRELRNSLQSHISRLRKAFTGAAEIDLSGRLHWSPGGYRLEVDSREVDLSRVEALVARSRVTQAEDPAAAATMLAEASSHWRGTALSDLATLPGWQTSGLAAFQARLVELEATIRDEMLEAQLAAGAHAETLPDLEEAAVGHPFREHTHRLLALALYRAGRQTDALATLRRYRDHLVDETGLDPSERLTTLEQAILVGDPELAAPAPGPTPDRAATPSRPSPARPVSRHKCVGREPELHRLLQHLVAVESGHGGVGLVAGEPGIGKTRLLTELAEVSRRRGAVVLAGRCLAGIGTRPYQPFADALDDFLTTAPGPAPTDRSAIAPLIPRWPAPASEPSGTSLTPDELQLRLLESLSRFLRELAAAQPVVVSIDDLHWADPSVIAMLLYLAHSTREHRLVILGAYRSGELTEDHPLRDMLGELRTAADCSTVHLTGLEPAAIGDLLETTTGRRISPHLTRAIAAETGGNPLFAREMIRYLLENDLLRADDTVPLDADLPFGAVPEGVRQVIARRLRRLSPATNDLLAVASAIDGPFPLEPVAEVARLFGTTALTCLDEALDAGVVHAASAADRYEFAHALVRTTVYTAQNPSRRLRLHLNLGEALQVARGQGIPIEPAEIAVQFHRSMPLPGAVQGLEPALEAAARARVTGANEANLEFLQMARGFASPADHGRAEVLTQLAIALAWSLRFDDATVTGREAVHACAQQADRTAAAAAAADIAVALAAAGSNLHAWQITPLGLDWTDGPDGVRPVSWAQLSLLDLERREAADPTNPGIPLDRPERRRAVQILHDHDVLAGKADLGRYAMALLHEHRSEVPAASAEDPTIALFLLGDFPGALRAFAADADAAHARGQLAWELYCRSGMSRCHAALGNLTEAVAALADADNLADWVVGIRTSWPRTAHLGAQDALAMALDTGWEEMLAASAQLLRPGLPEHQWAIATLEAASARGHARMGENTAALQLLDRPVRALRQAPDWSPNYLRTACDAAETLWLTETVELRGPIEAALRKSLRGDFRFPMMDSRLALARLCTLDGRADEARGWFARARTVLDAQAARTLRAIVDHDEALLDLRLGKHSAAERLMSSAVAQFRNLGMSGWLRRAAHHLGTRSERG